MERGVSRTVAADVQGGGGQVVITFGYRTSDPYAVAVRIASFRVQRVWLVGRDLLGDGSHVRTGDGDVVLEPIGDGRVRMTFKATWPGDPTLVVDFGKRDLHAFLKETYHLVPAYAEGSFLDLDSEIERLLMERP